MKLLNSEQIKEICRVQHKITVCDILISKMPLGYTQDDIGQLEKDLEIKTKRTELTNELSAIISKYGTEAIGDTFSNKELLQKPENRFTLDDQRQATREVIGKELTLEEVIERYS